MLDKLKQLQKEPSIAALELAMQFKPQIRDSNRLNTFTATGVICPECHHNICEITTSVYSRDIISIMCLRCGAQW
jgi:hypothetical protein